MSSKEKLVIFTGGTAGLGLNALEQLVSNRQNESKPPSQFAYRIFIGARSTSDGKLQASLDKIRQSSPSPLDVKIALLPLDLTSPDSIENFAQHVLSTLIPTFRKIDTMVLNAGILLRTPQQAVRLSNGREFENCLFVNALSQSLLLKRLLPVMADDGRIVLVNSMLHFKAVREPPVTPTTIGDYLGPEKWEGQLAYQISKLVQMHLSFILKDEIQRRWSSLPAGPTVVTVSLGFVPNTNLARNYPWVLQQVAKYMLPLIPFTTPLHVAGGVILRAMFDRTLSSGTYLSKTGAMDAAAECYDLKRRDEWRKWLVEQDFWTTETK